MTRHLERPICQLCNCPLGEPGCNHIWRTAGQVTMSEIAWRRLCDELAELRNATLDEERLEAYWADAYLLRDET